MIEFRSDSFAIFRDDLFPFLGGGNKARKMMALHNRMQVEKYTSIVTTGGIQSNHCRAVALYCKKYSLECTLVIHGSEKDFFQQSGNAKIIRDTNAKLIFCDSKSIGIEMDNAMELYKSKGDVPFYLYGGGHILEGAKAYIDVIGDIAAGDYIPDQIFVASGTGSTHAGILAGVAKYELKTKVIGISVGREKEKEEKVVKEFYDRLCKKYEIVNNRKEVIVEDKFLCGGYGKYNQEIKEIEKNSLVEHNIFLDATYTGKVFYGMKQIIKEKSSKANTLFWYTGGIYNYLAND
ncbi:MAG: pyridoxal-phosphate dependent enzyme [Algibacter sp.]